MVTLLLAICLILKINRPMAYASIGGSSVNISYTSKGVARYYNFELRIRDLWGNSYIVPLRGWVYTEAWARETFFNQSLVLLPGITDGPFASSSTNAILRMSDSLTPDVDFVDRPITWRGILSFPSLRRSLSVSLLIEHHY
jgi:hypothetical protein